MISAFATRRHLVLGQVKVNEKSNEIVTIDAMGCQRDIATKIIDRKGIACARSKAIKDHCARMAQCSWPNRRQTALQTRRSAGTNAEFEPRMPRQFHNLIRKAPSTDSLRLRRKAAAWDDDFLANLIAA